MTKVVPCWTFEPVPNDNGVTYTLNASTEAEVERLLPVRSYPEANAKALAELRA